MKAKSLIIVAMLLSLAVSGCAAKENRSQTTTPTTSVPLSTIEASEADNGKDITLAVGDTLRLTLTANHSTPFRWAVDTRIGDTAVLQQTGHQYLASTTTGGPGSEFWTFKALKVGTTTIANEEAPIAAAGQAPHAFNAKVTVK